MKKDTLKIGFVGAKAGKSFGIRGFAIPNVHEINPTRPNQFDPIPGVELSAVADVDELSAIRAKEFFGFANHYTDYLEMIEKEALDAVVVLVPTFLHKQVTIDCLRAGLHVLCEKPPTNNYQEMEEVAAEVRSSGKKYMFIRQSRFSPAVQAARKLVLEGKLGDIYAADARWIRSRGSQIQENAWRSQKDSGGGVLLDLGIHGIDQAWFCMGNPTPIEVTAATYTAFKEFSREPENYTADDTFAGSIRFENGTFLQCLFAFGINAVHPAAESDKVEDSLGTEWQISKLYGTRGGIDIKANHFIDGPVDSLQVKNIEIRKTSDSDFVVQARHFIESIQRDTEPLNSLDHACQLMKMLTALRISGEERRSIRLEELEAVPA
ncbi:MAG: Gfo/Idh/MocA family oxidoreductase [Verrucomicrobiota bacterium]